ncbi:MAG: nicotinate (nicotinamide) nucleotide adenylyltransferase [Dehalococcoidia bacterium]|nr:nicotinate (nicotinamide) nucleotide adenylyltransferase [Dehalococcoidia bacterium]
MRVGLLGGTFDPPHLGHLALAAAAHDQLDLDRVLFAPAGHPYRKASRLVSRPEVRLRMVEAAVGHFPWAEVSMVDLEESGPTYTAETLARLAAVGGDWWFVAGEDVLVDLPHWREPGRIVGYARLAVASRPPYEGRVPTETVAAVPGIEGRIDWIELPPLTVSSTELRRRVAVGVSTELWLPEAVREVVDRLGLYRD